MRQCEAPHVSRARIASWVRATWPGAPENLRGTRGLPQGVLRWVRVRAARISAADDVVVLLQLGFSLGYVQCTQASRPGTHTSECRTVSYVGLCHWYRESRKYWIIPTLYTVVVM